MQVELALGAAALVCLVGWLRTHLRLKAIVRQHANREQSSRFLEEERRILEMVAQGASLKGVLDELTHAIERMATGCFCSILLLDEDGRRLRQGASGSLPAEYMRQVDGLPIGPDVGSCGSAAFRNETIIVNDIATDHRWAAAKQLPLGFGLRACWSVPIRNSSHGVLGTFAMYHQAPTSPDPWLLKVVEAGAHLAGNAIERLTAERKLRDSMERLDVAERAAGFGVWELDPAANFLTLSAGAARLSGFEDAPVKVGRGPLEELIHPEDLAAVQAASDRALKFGESFEVEFRVVKPDGGYRWCRSRGSAEQVDGRTVRTVGAIIDITQQRQMMDQLRESERQLAHKQKLESIGQLAAGVAHEINTPIQYIGDNAEFLQEAFSGLISLADAVQQMQETTAPIAITSGTDWESLQFYRTEIPSSLGQLREGVARVAAIVRAMKEFSHPGPVERVPLDINRGIESTILVSSHEWKYVAEITTDLDRQLPPVPCIAGEFNQVILNLIVNAVHAISDVVQESGSKGRIHISTRNTGGCVEIRVSDTGSGIPDSVQPKVFDPFFTTKPVGKGTGQGLALAHAVIVQKHKGTIHLESKIGSGTTFVIRLPLADMLVEV